MFVYRFSSYSFSNLQQIFRCLNKWETFFFSIHATWSSTYSVIMALWCHDYNCIEVWLDTKSQKKAMLNLCFVNTHGQDRRKKKLLLLYPKQSSIVYGVWNKKFNMSIHVAIVVINYTSFLFILITIFSYSKKSKHRHKKNKNQVSARKKQAITWRSQHEEEGNYWRIIYQVAY